MPRRGVGGVWRRERQKRPKLFWSRFSGWFIWRDLWSLWKSSRAKLTAHPRTFSLLCPEIIIPLIFPQQYCELHVLFVAVFPCPGAQCNSLKSSVCHPFPHNIPHFSILLSPLPFFQATPPIQWLLPCLVYRSFRKAFTQNTEISAEDLWMERGMRYHFRWVSEWVWMADPNLDSHSNQI